MPVDVLSEEVHSTQRDLHSFFDEAHLLLSFVDKHFEKSLLKLFKVLTGDLFQLASFYEGKNLVLAVLPHPKFVAGPVPIVGRLELIKALL